jgi:hypothetical protein
VRFSSAYRQISPADLPKIEICDCKPHHSNHFQPSEFRFKSFEDWRKENRLDLPQISVDWEYGL